MTSTSPQGGPARNRQLPAVTAGRLVALGLATLAVVFIAQNRDRVRISLFTIDVTAPIWLILTVMVLVGMAVGVLLRGRR